MAKPELIKEMSPSAVTGLLVWLTAFQTTLLSRILAEGATADSGHQIETRMLTIPEVATRLSVPRAYAYELARRGELPIVRVGKKYIRVPQAAFEKWLTVQQLDSHPTAAYSPRHRRG